MLFTCSDKRTPFSELERFQPLSGYKRVSSESGAHAKTGAGNEPRYSSLQSIERPRLKRGDGVLPGSALVLHKGRAVSG